MPFTLSHVAAALPFARGRWALPIAPLVLGSMAPDVWLFLGVSRLRDASHSAVGVVTVDLAVVVVAGLVWHHLLRAPVLALLPPLAARWPDPVPCRRDGRWAARWLLAAGLGTSTHVVWDLFTHGDARVERGLGPLAGPHLGVDSETWLQYGSSVVGVLLVGAVVARWWRRTTPRFRPEPVTASRGRVAVLAALVTATLAGAAYRAEPLGSVVLAMPADVGPWRLRLLATHLALGAGVALVVALVVVAVAWHVADRRARPAAVDPGPADVAPVGRSEP